MRAGTSARGRLRWTSRGPRGLSWWGSSVPWVSPHSSRPALQAEQTKLSHPTSADDLRAGLQMLGLITQENGRAPTQLPWHQPRLCLGCALLFEVLPHLPDIGFCRRTGDELLPLKPEGLATFRDSRLVFRLWPGIGMNPREQGFPRVRHPRPQGWGARWQLPLARGAGRRPPAQPFCHRRPARQ